MEERGQSRQRAAQLERAAPSTLANSQPRGSLFPTPESRAAHAHPDRQSHLTPTSPSTPGLPHRVRADTQGPPGKRKRASVTHAPMADVSPLLPPGKPPATTARFARCASSANDELRSFRACLAWLCVDHSSSPRVAAVGSWAVFLLLAVAAPAAVRLLGTAPPRPFDGQVQVSLTLAASLAYVCLRALLHRAGGLRRLLHLDSLRRDSEDVQAGYAAQLARSFRVLACFVLPCALAEAAYKAYWYRAAAAAYGSPWWWAAAACAVEVASWVYRVALFFMVCVLFRVICYLQILRMVGFAREFGRFADVATVLQHHRRIREQLRKISHRYRKFIVCSLVLVSASQFAALLATTRPHAIVNLATAGELAVSD